MAQKRTVELQVIVDDKGTTKKLKVDADQLENALAKTGKQQKNFRKQQRGVNQTAQSGSKNFANLTGGIMSGGGLVAAYATLAAQIFAVTAAFGFLKEAGSLAQLQAGQTAYAATVGTSIRSLTENIIDATDAQINFRDAAQAAAIGTASGLSAQQLTDLGAAAKTTSLVLGRDLTDSFNRLIRGVTKAEPELLDELGIILRLEKATGDYAASLGKSAKDLSAFERSQAVAVDTLGQVDEKFGAVASSSNLAANEFAKLGKSFDDLVNDIRMIAVELAGPIAQLLQDFPQLIALAFAPFAAQVAGAALPQLATLGDKLEGVTGIAEGMFERLTDQQEQYALAQARAADPKAASAALRKRTREVFKAISKEENLRKNSVLNNIRNGKRLTQAQITRLRGQLNQETGLYANFNKKRKADLLKLLREMEIQNKVSAGKMARDMGAGISKIQVRLTGLGVTAAKTFTKVAGFAAVAGRAMSAAFSFLSIVSTIALLGSLVFAFFRTKKEIDETELKLQVLTRTLGNVNEEFAEFQDQQNRINSSLDRGKEAFAAFANRIENIDGSQFRNLLDAEIINNSAVSMEAFNDEVEKNERKLKRSRLGERLRQFQYLESQGRLNARTQKTLNELTDQYEAALKDTNKGYLEFIANNEDAGESAQAAARFLKDNLTFLENLDNEYLEGVPMVERYRAALKRFDETGEAIPKNLEETGNQIVNTGNKIDSFLKRTADNAAAFTKVLSNFIPDTPVDSLIQGLQAARAELEEIEADTGKILEKDITRKAIMKEQIELLERIRDMKQMELRIDNALEVARIRGAAGLTKNLKEEFNLNSNILKQRAVVVKAEQKIGTIIEAARQAQNRLDAAKNKGLELSKAEREELERITGGKQRAIEAESLRIEKAEAHLEVLKRQNNEIMQIVDHMTQVLENELQRNIAKVLKGEEGQIIDAMRNIVKGLGMGLADIMAKQVTTDIMRKLFQIKSPEEKMKAAIEEAFKAAEARTASNIILSSQTGAEHYKKAIIEASGGTYTAPINTPGGNNPLGTNPTIPSANTASSPTTAILQRIAALPKKGFDFLFGKGLTVAPGSTEYGEDAGGEGVGANVVAKSGGPLPGVFREFIDNFGDIFKQNTVGGFLGQLGRTFMSGITGFGELFRSILGGIGGLLGGGGGFLSMLIPGMRYGGMTKNYSTGGIARGPQSGYPAMLHGNEAVVPLPDGNKIPVDLGAGAGGVNNVSVNVNVASDGQATTEMTGDRAGGLGKAVAVAVQEELQRQKRPGGILSPFGAA